MRWGIFQAQSIYRFQVSPLGNCRVASRLCLVCLAGGRSVKALQQAVAAGRKDICHYAPGTGGWRNRGSAVVA